ncbi:MAG: SDR family oxidoreductase [Acidimicrobiales bacterium]|jgi:NAD(P)-dependent dehydrogenase (short-subunit alcohol dehydrogenase family)
MTIALITGASRGLGRELAEELAGRGWSLVLDARHPDMLAEAERAIRPRLAPDASLVAIAGDVADDAHRRALVVAADHLGGLDLVVNNASTLGATPLPHLAAYPIAELTHVLEVNIIAPLALIQEALVVLRRSARPAVLNITSDASVEPYEGWGGYGLSKAALDHMSAILAVEEPSLLVWAVDPGDMRTQMHQDAFPGEDISDRPLPAEVVADLAALVEAGLPSGRYRRSDLAPVTLPSVESEAS